VVVSTLATLLPRTRREFGFDGKNARARRVAERLAGGLIADASAAVKAAVRAIVVRSIRDGIPPLEAARLIREVIGLDERRAQAVANYRASLFERGLDAQAIRSEIEDYAEELIGQRAETIARTEIMGALNEGALETWRQAREDGFITGAARKEWLATEDELTCPICEPLDGVQVGLEETFPSGDLVPPAHPNCRCATVVTEPLP